MSKRIISILILCMLATGIFASCSKKDTTQPVPSGDVVTPENGGTLNLACVSIDTMNPLVTKHASISDFLSLIYEGLFVTNTDLTVEPALAEDYTVSENNTVYTIKLKNNISFHNGKKFTAEDVIATLDYMALYSPRWYDTIKYIAGYGAEGDYTVVIRLNSAKSDFASNLDFPILPAGLMGDDFLTPNPDFIPVGTGMYKYVDTVAYKNIMLGAYENWRGATDRAHIDEVNIEILSDEKTIVSAFDAGTIDALTTSWMGSAELNLTSALFNTFECEENRFTYVGINTNSENFDTAKERRVLWNSIDSEKITQDIMLGKGIVATSPVREGVYFNSPEADESPVVTDDKKGEGAEDVIKECKILYNSENKTKSRIAAALKQQLESKGYLVTLDGQPYALYSNMVLVGDYQLYVGEVQMTRSCDLAFMFSSPMNGFCNYDDEELRTLVINLDMAVGEKEKEIAWENFEKYYVNSAVQVPLFFSPRATFVNRRVMGSLKPNLSNFFYGLDDMFIKHG